MDSAFDIILKNINDKYKTNKKYKVKYSNSHYLKYILMMLNQSNHWAFLQNLKFAIDVPKNHYKTIYNKYIKWSNDSIFFNSFNNYLPIKNKNEKIETLIIDSTFISNKHRSEKIAMNPEYKKKNVTKLSCISTNNKFILSIIESKTNNRRDNFNEDKNYKTHEHEVKSIQKTLNQINNKIETKNKIFLLGDKAYVTKSKYELNGKEIKILRPIKKNDKNYKLDETEKKKLKERYKIENVFCSLKKYERIILRKDRKIKNYMSFVYITSLIENIRINNNFKRNI